MEAISQLFESAETFIKEKNYAKALNELAKVYRIDPKNYNAHAFFRPDRDTNGGLKLPLRKTQMPQSIESMPDIAALEQPVTLVDNDIPKGLQLFRNHNQHQTTCSKKSSAGCIVQGVLKECWATALLLQKNQICFHECVTIFPISFDHSHCQIEAAQTIDAYVDALRNVWLTTL